MVSNLKVWLMSCRTSIPLCVDCHTQGHTKGWKQQLRGGGRIAESVLPQKSCGDHSWLRFVLAPHNRATYRQYRHECRLVSTMPAQSELDHWSGGRRHQSSCPAICVGGSVQCITLISYAQRPRHYGACSEKVALNTRLLSTKFRVRVGCTQESQIHSCTL